MATILVVEDEPGIALGLEDTLRLEGYCVEVAANGASAIRRACETRFDLILLDVMLPGRNGFEVCRELRQSGLAAPIIFLTARTLENDRVSGLDLGANDYVIKPFSPRELVARVRAALRFAETTRNGLERLEQEIDAAARVQRRLFPSSAPPVPGVDYAGACRPALGVSGDYYDFFVLPSGCLALVVADVCGKGVAAALVAASLQAAVRASAPTTDRRSGELLVQLNRMLVETTSLERYATIFYAVYDPFNRTLTWSNAGHCAPILIDAEGAVTRLESLVMPAGIVSDLPVFERTVRLSHGDLLVAYTDGIPDACNDAGEEFGESRILSSIHQGRHLAASRQCEAILDDVKVFGGSHQRDDHTVLAARFVYATEAKLRAS